LNTMSHTFATSPYHDSVLQVRSFMFNDIEKTLCLTLNPQIGAPNFLLALGLCCYTEYWGKLVEGIKKSESKRSGEAFNSFLTRLDEAYYKDLLTQVNLYHEVRCGLAHSYLIEGKGNAVINTSFEGLHGIDFDNTTKQYIFWVRTYFDEFKNAVNNYINGLETGKEDLQKLEDSLNSRPELI
jgi:hypothetical protein